VEFVTRNCRGVELQDGLSVTVTVHAAEVRNLLRGTRGPVGRAMYSTGLQVTNRAKRLCPVDTGRLRASIQTSPPGVNGRGIVVRSGTNVKYARFVHGGRGVIRPRRAKVLRFKTRSGKVVYTKKVRAVRGVPFLAMALQQEVK
jgi:hypothetical protein